MSRSLPVLLACQSYFSEGRSTVSPRRLVQEATRQGFETVGLADWCSVAGAVELCEAAREAGVGALIGVTLPVRFPAPPRSSHATEAFPLVLLARSREGYALLCELITHRHLESPDGVPLTVLQAVAARGRNHLTCLTGGRTGFPTILGERREIARAAGYLRTLRAMFPFDLYLGVTPVATRKPTLSFQRLPLLWPGGVSKWAQGPLRERRR